MRKNPPSSTSDYQGPWGRVHLLIGAFTILGVGTYMTAAATQRQPTLDDLLKIPKSYQPEPERTPVGLEGGITERENRSAISISEVAAAFETAVQEMRVATNRLGLRRDGGIETQRLQESILAKLDRVVDAAILWQGNFRSSAGEVLRQDTGSTGNAQSSTAGASPSNTSANDQGFSKVGRKATGRTESDAAAMAPWGNLPQRLRDELLQGINERFSPLYKGYTEAYYRRLAEEAP